MSVIEVWLPVLKVNVRLTTQRGRAWSLIERGIIEVLAKESTDLTELCSGFQLHQSIVVSAITRLMRVEWVRMTNSSERLLFSVTSAGHRALSEEELPYAGRIIKRKATLLLDCLCGHAFTLSELDHRVPPQAGDFASSQPTILIPPKLPKGAYRIDELVDVTIRDNEQLINIDASVDDGVDRVVLVKLVDGEIIGLPPNRSFPELIQTILSAASKQFPLRSSRRSTFHGQDKNSTAMRVAHAIHFDPKDLIVGGKEHRQQIESMLRNAATRVIIHSTFLAELSVRSLLTAIVEAAKRGVRIDILWGQEQYDDPRFFGAGQTEQRATAFDVATRLKSDPQIVACNDRIRFHMVSTRSHAKIVLADIGGVNQFVAVVGSCNWLASGYNSVEVSVCLRTPTIVSEVVRCLIRLLRASDGSNQLEVLKLLKVVDLLNKSSSVEKPNAKASLVIGEEHNECILRARDEAKQRIFLASHRISNSVKPAIIAPFAEACTRKSVQVTALYGRLQNGMKKQETNRLIQSATQKKVHFVQVQNPRIHAKVLAWDKNSIVVTSQNWLSADPGGTSLATELGVMIDCAGAAEMLIGRMRSKVHNRNKSHKGKRRRR